MQAQNQIFDFDVSIYEQRVTFGAKRKEKHFEMQQDRFITPTLENLRFINTGIGTLILLFGA